MGICGVCRARGVEKAQGLTIASATIEVETVTKQTDRRARLIVPRTVRNWATGEIVRGTRACAIRARGTDWCLRRSVSVLPLGEDTDRGNARSVPRELTITTGIPRVRLLLQHGMQGLIV